MPSLKYTADVLQSAVNRSVALTEVLKNLGVKSYSGGMSNYIRDRIKHYGIDTSHFLGYRHNLGKAPATKKRPKDILILRRNGYRAKALQLRRALKELGIPYRCAECGCKAEWQKKPLTLEVDHINGNWQDCRKGNLRFLCPNCHAQTQTFRRTRG